MQLGELLLRLRQVTPGNLKIALTRQQQKGGHLGTILVRIGAITNEQLFAALQSQRETRVHEMEGVLERHQAGHGPAHRSTDRAHYELARALLDAGRPADAMPHAKAAFDGSLRHGRYDNFAVNASRLVAEARQALRPSEQRGSHT
jgi:hypothetical protein